MLQIKKATKEDIEKIRSVALRTWPVTFSNILSEEQISYMLDWMYSPGALIQHMEEKKHVFLIAMEQDICIGFCAYELHAKENRKTKIQKIYLLPEAQGKGIGKILLEEVTKIAREAGDSHLFLNVNRFNQQAIDFYGRVGFYEDFREVIDIGNGYVMDDIVMEKNI